MGSSTSRRGRGSFERYIGIDYSGAGTSDTRLAGLRVGCAEAGSVRPVASPESGSRRRNWTRRGLATWLIETLRDGPRTIVGIDHAFSFPQAYFDRYGLSDWRTFLADFARHWPTDQAGVSVESIRKGGPARTGTPDELRLAERWTNGAKSVFRFDVQGQVAKSTHAGLPWLRQLDEQLGDAVFFWPFDGLEPRPGRHVIAEVFPSLWRRRYEPMSSSPDEHDACAVARWLMEMDGRGALGMYFGPPVDRDQGRVVQREGWILGVM